MEGLGSAVAYFLDMMQALAPPVRQDVQSCVNPSQELERSREEPATFAGMWEGDKSAFCDRSSAFGFVEQRYI
eukprot:5654707-Amphidinium_carterae.1